MKIFMTNCFIIIISLLGIVIQENLAQYVPPTPSVEPLYPVGLRMSIARKWNSFMLFLIYFFIILYYFI